MPAAGAEAPAARERLDAFPARYIRPRTVEVWLPPGYADGAGRYPVLYIWRRLATGRGLTG